MKDFILLILDFVLLTKVSIGTIGPTSLRHIYLFIIIIININININYLLQFIFRHNKIGPTCTLYTITRVTGRSDS
jgi:hypothetical protein